MQRLHISDIPWFFKIIIFSSDRQWIINRLVLIHHSNSDVFQQFINNMFWTFPSWSNFMAWNIFLSKLQIIFIQYHCTVDNFLWNHWNILLLSLAWLLNYFEFDDSFHMFSIDHSVNSDVFSRYTQLSCPSFWPDEEFSLDSDIAILPASNLWSWKYQKFSSFSGALNLIQIFTVVKRPHEVVECFEDHLLMIHRHFLFFSPEVSNDVENVEIIRLLNVIFHW